MHGGPLPTQTTWGQRSLTLEPLLAAHPVSVVSLIALTVSALLGGGMLIWIGWTLPRWIALVKRRKELKVELAKIVASPLKEQQAMLSASNP